MRKLPHGIQGAGLGQRRGTGCRASSQVAQGMDSTRQCKRHGFNPWVGKNPWRRKWQPTPVFLPKNSIDRGALVGYGSWSHKEWDNTEWLSVHIIPSDLAFKVPTKVPIASRCAGHHSAHQDCLEKWLSYTTHHKSNLWHLQPERENKPH